MFKNTSYPTNFFNTNKATLMISGLTLPMKGVNLISRVLYYCYSFCLYSTAMTFFFYEIFKLQDTVKNPTKFFSHIGLLFTHIVGILKACLLVFGRHRIEKVMNMLQDDEFRYEALRGFQPGKMLHSWKKKSSNVTVLVFVLYTLAGVSAFASAWTSITLKVQGQHFEGNVTCYDFLPFYFQIPFPVETKSQCQHAFTFMGVALCVFAWCIACHDGIFCALLSCVKTQLEIVEEAIRTIRCRTLKKVFLPPSYSTLHDEDCPELEKALHKELNHCIKHLSLLLQVGDDLESIFTYVTLAQTLGSIMIISSCLFVAITVPITSPIFFSQAEYFFCILLQLWLICNFGNEITYSSGQITRSLYESDWFSCSLRYKKSMVIIMSRMQRPFYISIGKFTPLTLITFVAQTNLKSDKYFAFNRGLKYSGKSLFGIVMMTLVCRGSFSYFTVFKTIQ